MDSADFKPKTVDIPVSQNLFAKPRPVDNPTKGRFCYSSTHIIQTRKAHYGKKELNAEEIAELLENLYVSNIISGRIFFTPEFKRVAYSQLFSGKTMREIFKDKGIDQIS